MSVYTYFILGIILGLAVAIVIGADISEKFENEMKFQKKTFGTAKLDNVIIKAANKIADKIQEREEDISEAEKNEIIAQCCKEEFGI